MSCSLSLRPSTIHEPGASSTSATPTTYHVFFSFRGSDTRDDFAAWLCHELEASGLRTFHDDDEIERGENIDREIEKAIGESQAGLIVFSPDYASSPYCLNEVVMLMERNRTNGIPVIPVFFKVDPFSISKQTGSFGVSFQQHEKKLQRLRREDRKNERRRLDQWREALREAADLGGMVYQRGPQPEFVKNVVKEVLRKVKYMPFSVPAVVVGRDSELKKITSWIQDASAYPRIALIYGMGGVGKTTIAKIVYNQHFNEFGRSCFLANVKEASEQSKGLVRLQKQLLTRIQRGGTHDFDDSGVGTTRIRDAICHKRVLIVLDNVDQWEHLNALIGEQDWLYKGSKIIITTRNKGLLKSWNTVFCVDVHPWCNDSASLELFSWNAFGQAHPVEAYMNVSERAVQLCCGLPLALEVLGSSLSRSSVASWQSRLGKLDIIIENEEVKKVLRISYESLKDDRDKNLFLDVACFFIGMDKECVQEALEGSDMYITSSLKRLVNWCLVTIDENNKLSMHPLIRDMARDIIRQESSNLGERSRIWHHKDAVSILQKNNGTGAIRTFILDQEQLELPPELELLHLKAEALRRMNNLKFLHLKNARFQGDFDGFPNSLVWCSWHGFPLSSIPRKMISDDLVVLDLQYSRLQFCWEGSLNMMNLKILNLSHSNLLVTTPDFQGLPSLKTLVLSYCINLVKINESIGLLKQLSSLDLTGCRNLLSLPWEIANSTSLKELSLAGCFGLYHQVQKIQGSSSLPAMQTMLSFPKFLVKLNLENCNISDSNIPRDLGVLSSLEHLNLSFNPISTLPESIARLAFLSSLWLMGCEQLRSLPQLPGGLQDLIIVKCRSLQRIASIPTSTAQRSLPVCYENLVEIGDMFKLQEIQSTDNEMIDGLHIIELISTEDMKMKWFHHMTGLIKWTANQVLHEFGIFNIFLPGSQIPTKYRYQTRDPLLQFRVPRHTPGKVTGLNLCVLYKEADADGHPPEMPYAPFQVVIWNISGNREWTYSPTAHVVTCELPMRDRGVAVKNGAKLLWLSRWNVRGQLQRGHLVAVVVLSPHDIEVERFGIRLLYEKEVDHKDQAIVSLNHSYKSCNFTSHQLVHFPTTAELAGITCKLEMKTWEKLLGLLCSVVFLALAHAHAFHIADSIFPVIEDACDIVSWDTIWKIVFVLFRARFYLGWFFFFSGLHIATTSCFIIARWLPDIPSCLYTGSRSKAEADWHMVEEVEELQRHHGDDAIPRAFPVPSRRVKGLNQGGKSKTD